MKKSLPIPAHLWLAAKTDEQRKNLIAEHTVDCSAEEIAERIEQDRLTAEHEALAAVQIVKDEAKKALEEIDRKSIRALREGNSARLAALEAEAETHRKTLRGE
jgi:CHASE3 domain sensor protein